MTVVICAVPETINVYEGDPIDRFTANLMNPLWFSVYRGLPVCPQFPALSKNGEPE